MYHLCYILHLFKCSCVYILCSLDILWFIGTWNLDPFASSFCSSSLLYSLLRFDCPRKSQARGICPHPLRIRGSWSGSHLHLSSNGLWSVHDSRDEREEGIPYGDLPWSETTEHRQLSRLIFWTNGKLDDIWRYSVMSNFQFDIIELLVEQLIRLDVTLDVSCSSFLFRRGISSVEKGLVCLGMMIICSILTKNHV